MMKKKCQHFLIIQNLQDRLIVLDGWSKAYAMTGWRMGWSVWPEELIPHVNKLIINSVSCVNAAITVCRNCSFRWTRRCNS